MRDDASAGCFMWMTAATVLCVARFLCVGDGWQWAVGAGRAGGEVDDAPESSPDQGTRLAFWMIKIGWQARSKTCCDPDRMADVI